MRVAAAIGQAPTRRAASIVEFEPQPRYTVQDVLLGEITWEELGRASA
ncbi:hypothetical protein ABTX61_09160 [Amycolatopsis japonica]